MRRLLLRFLLPLLVVPIAQAQEECPSHFEEAADSLAEALSAQKSCKAAEALLDKCQWGSSADTEFAPIVIEKCEKEFLGKLSAAGQDNYVTQMQLCAYEYSRQEGTLFMSAAAMCQVGVAAEFAANPATNDHPLAKASFDCTKAQTPLEKAICSDIRLGHADIVLSNAYKPVLDASHGVQRTALIDSERKWLAGVPGVCGLTNNTPTPATLSCIRIAFELRFTALDGCRVAGDEESDIAACVDSRESSAESAPDQGTAPGERASFDCETPQTALEIVICADAELGQKDIALAQAYREADARMDATQHQKLVESERNWLRFVTSSCPLGAVGGIPSVFTRACVRSAFEVRIGQLQSCPQKPRGEQLPCLDDFQLLAK